MKPTAWLLLPLSLLALPLAGQHENDRTAVAIAVSSALRTDPDLPDGETGFIPVPGMESAADEAARVVGGHVTTLEAAIRCGKLPSSCELVDAAVLIRVREPSISEDHAQVMATVWWETRSPRTPVAVKTVLVTLQREGSSWVVTKKELRTIT